MNTPEFRAQMARHQDTGEILAEAMGMSAQTMSAKINGKSKWDQDEISFIKNRYNLSPEQVDHIFLS